MSDRTHPSAKVVSFFQMQDLGVAEVVLSICKNVVKTRQQATKTDGAATGAATKRTAKRAVRQYRARKVAEAAVPLEVAQ